MRKLFFASAAIAMLGMPISATAQVKQISGPGGMVCNHTNSCACKPSLNACVACNNTHGQEAQRNWCKMTNPALR